MGLGAVEAEACAVVAPKANVMPCVQAYVEVIIPYCRLSNDTQFRY